MAITLDATKGGPASNSYATVEEADAYLETEYGAEEWSDLPTADKQKLLITATRMIDGLAVRYDSLDRLQALNFPLERTPDGFTDVRVACILQAFYYYLNADGIKEALQMAIQV